MEEMTMSIGQSKKTLFRSAMKNDWGKILDICGKTPKAHTVQTTRTGDTLLHLAVADGEEEVVRQLAELITKPENKAIKSTALGISNERKNMLRMAKPDLIGYCNVDGETPFFLAALHGKLDAFLCLDIICKEKGKNGLSYARRNDGESVLHTAMVTILFRVKQISKIIMIVISQQMLKTLKDNKDMLNTKEGGGIPGPGVLPVPKEDETTPYILGEGGSKVMGPSDLWPEGVASPQPTDPKNPDSESNKNG
ncbi:hypothetical protein LguiA_020429 [Lonicera macranthoides]